MPNIIDIEASGFGAHSYPIEIGLVTEERKRYCRLIKPLPEWTHWSEEAEGLHGISRRLLLQNGVPAQQVCTELNQMLTGKTIYSDGWVVDQPWLIRLFHGARMDMTFRISPLEMILSEGQMEQWRDTKQRLSKVSARKRHRASVDAELIQNTFIATRQMLANPAIISKSS